MDILYIKVVIVTVIVTLIVGLGLLALVFRVLSKKVEKKKDIYRAGIRENIMGLSRESPIVVEYHRHRVREEKLKGYSQSFFSTHFALMLVGTYVIIVITIL